MSFLMQTESGSLNPNPLYSSPFNRAPPIDIHPYTPQHMALLHPSFLPHLFSRHTPPFPTLFVVFLSFSSHQYLSFTETGLLLSVADVQINAHRSEFGRPELQQSVSRPGSFTRLSRLIGSKPLSELLEDADNCYQSLSGRLPSSCLCIHSHVPFLCPRFCIFSCSVLQKAWLRKPLMIALGINLAQVDLTLGSLP